MLFPVAIGYQIKNPVPPVGNLFQAVVHACPRDPSRMMQAIALALGCPQELGGKTLLQGILNTLVKGCGQLKLVLGKNLPAG